jgi:hypothetical protein
MSEGRKQPLLGDDMEEDVPKRPQRSSSLNKSEKSSRRSAENSSFDTIGQDLESTLSQRRGMNTGIPQSYPPGSSRTGGVDDPFKGTTADEDVEAQASDQSKNKHWGCSNCPSWIKQIEFQKWYEWMSYYVPILEWLPQYKRMLTLCTELIKSELYFPRFICRINFG